jgi:hypothetical protein
MKRRSIQKNAPLFPSQNILFSLFGETDRSRSDPKIESNMQSSKNRKTPFEETKAPQVAQSSTSKQKNRSITHGLLRVKDIETKSFIFHFNISLPRIPNSQPSKNNNLHILSKGGH